MREFAWQFALFPAILVAHLLTGGSHETVSNVSLSGYKHCAY
jgi:hypothetical protein